MSKAGGGAERRDRDLAGRLVAITGASRGIGAAVAAQCAALGAQVVLLARTPELLEHTADNVRAAGGPDAVADIVQVDLRDTDAAAEAARRTLEVGLPDVVVSNAGHSIARSVLGSTDRFHDVSRLAGVNYLGAVAYLLPFLSPMAARGSGRIVHVSSVSTRIPAPGWASYCASKSAFDSWLRAAAPELRSAGISCGTVELGLVRTAMSAPTYGSTPPFSLSAEQAAARVVRSVTGTARWISPWWARVGAVLTAAAPDLSARTLQRMTAMTRRGR